MGIGPVRIEAEGHCPNLPRHAARFIRLHEPYGNVGFTTTQRNPLPLGNERKPDVRIFGSKAREVPGEKMRDQNRWRAERDPADKWRVGGLGKAGNAVGSSLHLNGSLEHLPSDRGKAAGSRQPIDKPHVKRGLKRGKSPADRGMVHFQATGSGGESAAPCHGQEMPDVFPISHLCEISRLTCIYTEFSQKAHERIS